MKIGKLKESILDRSVFKQIHKRNDNVLCKPKAGLGYQQIQTGPDTYMTVTVNTVEGTPFQAGALAVPRAVNSLVCSGAVPTGIMLSLTVPEETQEPEFRKMIHRIESDCQAENIDLAGGHTQVSPGVSRVIAGVTGLGVMRPGTGAGRGGASAAPRAGQSIIMTKWAGMSGAWLLEQEYHEAFVNKYNYDIAAAIAGMDQYFSVTREAAAALAEEACFLYDLSESGVFGGLWEAAQAGHTGLWVDLKAIPIRQEVVELCDFVDVNPYKIPIDIRIVIASEHGDRLVQTLKSQGIPAAVIGQFTQGNDRIVMNDDEVRYLEPPSGLELPKGGQAR